MVRTRTKSEDIEERLTAAALSILASEGPDALSVRKVATVAGVAPMGIYARFSSKAGLIQHLLSLGFERLADALNVEASSPSERLLRSGAAYRAFALANPDLYRLMFARGFANIEVSDEVHEQAGRAFGVLEAQVMELQNALDANSMDSVDVAMLFWSGVHGFVSLELDEKNFSSHLDATFAILVEALLSGITTQLIAGK